MNFIVNPREGSSNPPQYSCLENPKDGGAWWAAVYGDAQSQAWLKRLSSSSSIANPTNKESSPAQLNLQVLPLKTVLAPETHLYLRSTWLVQNSPTWLGLTRNCWMPDICVTYTGLVVLRHRDDSDKAPTLSVFQLYDQSNKIFISMCTFFISKISNCTFSKLWYIYTMEYYSAIKKNSFESVLMRWMKLEPIKF